MFDWGRVAERFRVTLALRHGQALREYLEHHKTKGSGASHRSTDPTTNRGSGSMARPKRICSVLDCGKPHLGLGYCSVHYYRAKNGGPVMRIPRGTRTNTLKMICLSTESKSCIIWPYSRNNMGYGTVSWEGRTQSAHRVICRLVHGEPPTPEHEAAHSCGKGHLGCCNPNHLSWKTPKENILDKEIHGTTPWGETHSNSRLTENQVRSIRASLLSDPDLAAIYGVARSTISRIQSGKLWARLKEIPR